MPVTKLKYILVFSCICLVCSLVMHSAMAQENPLASLQSETRSAKKAFAMSMVLPGWGHHYAKGGTWKGRATMYAGADIGLWLGLIGAEWRKNHFIQSYQTLAASRGNAIIEGKDRAFYLNLATFQSSDDYLTFQLRNRSWDRIDYVDDPGNHWAWENEDDFFKFRDLREDAESLRRRRSIFVALLVANRVLAGLSAIQAANKANARIELSISSPPPGERNPVLNMALQF